MKSWVREVLLRGRIFWDIIDDYSGSWIWRKLLKLWPLARPFCVAILDQERLLDFGMMIGLIYGNL